MKKIIFIMLAFLLAYACQDDDLTNEPNSGNPTEQNDALFQQNNFGISTSRNFIGRVVNVEGQRIDGAQVTIGNTVTTTDHNGVFVINNASVYEKFAYVKATKSGYLTGSKAIVPTSNGSNDIVITLLEKNVVATISSGEETVVDYEGSQIIFPGDFIDANGNPYSGQVEVSIHYLAPNRSETFAQMPGMLFGQTETNTAVSMETYGMLGVELLSPSGESLNLSEGSPAIVEFPITEEQLGIAPNTINLWHFDEDQGYWKEGSATRVGDTYVAEISHFSWWNCDLPLDYVSVCFSLISTNDMDLNNHYVEIIRDETNQMIFAGYTNVEGQECGLFPANENVTINVYGTEECQEDIIHTEQVGPFSSDGSFTVNVPLQNIETTTITATVNNCDGEPLTNGYAFFYDATTQNMFGDSQVINISNGIVNYDMPYCEGDNIYSMIVYDLDTNQNTGIIESIELLSPITELGILSTCEQSAGIFNGDVQLTSQVGVEIFGLLGYTEINGELLIGYTNQEDMTTDITDLSPLSSLNFISALKIRNNQDLINLYGLENLTGINDFILQNNDSLESLEALNNISGYVEWISIEGNADLISLEGLNGITACGNLKIGSQNLFVNLEGLNSLSNIGHFEINSCNSLTSISNLSNCIIGEGLYFHNIESLMSIEVLNFSNEMDVISLSNLPITSLGIFNNISELSYLSIYNCSFLETLDGFNNLENISTFCYIGSNDGLLSLSGLEGLSSIGGVLTIGRDVGGIAYPNSQLSDLCALQNLFINGTYNPDEVYIANNAYNPSIQDIIDGNCAQ